MWQEGLLDSIANQSKTLWSFDQHGLVPDDITRRKQCTDVTYFAFVQQLCKEPDVGIAVDAFGLRCADGLV